MSARVSSPAVNLGLPAAIKDPKDSASSVLLFIRGPPVYPVQAQNGASTRPSTDPVHPQKDDFQETKITVNHEAEKPESSEDTFSGEWRNGEDDTCTGDDSITRPLKREYRGYINKKKKMNRRSFSFKEELRREMNVGQFLKAKKSEWKLMGFVLLLFVLIVAALATVYHFQCLEIPPLHQSHNATVRLNELHMEIRNRDGRLVLSGNLWANVVEPPPFEVSNSHRLTLVWKNLKKLEVEHYELGLGTCHRITWSSLSQDPLNHADCFGLGNARWYGGGTLKTGMGTLESTSVPRQPLLTTNIHDTGTFGSVVERYWLSSEGVAILIDPESSFEFSINAFDELKNATDGQLCLYSAKQDYYLGKRNETGLNYTICVSDNVAQVRADTLPVLIPSVDSRELPDTLFENPVWSTWAYLKDSYNQSDVSQFAGQIVADGFKPGLFIIDDGWQDEEGDLDFEASRFPGPTALVDDLHAKGFQVSLRFRMQVSVKSPAFHNTTVQDSLVRDFSGEVPSLTRWWNGPRIGDTWDRGLAGVIDMRSANVSWLTERLSRLQTECGIDALHISGHEVSSLPTYDLIRAATADPNEYTNLGADLVSQFGTLSSTESASGSQQYSVLIRLSGGTSTWNGTGGLHTVIPTALTLGLLGYPWFILDSVGGSTFDGLPSKELYVRWFQVSAFLPIMHLSIPPRLYDSEVQTIVNNILELRARLLLPEVRRNISDPREAVLSPVIRPIWWLDPDDREAAQIMTEFLIGDDVLVAPVLEEGAVQRDVYLPKGLWKDAVLTVKHSGPVWLRNYYVSFSSVAYFIRQ